MPNEDPEILLFNNFILGLTSSLLCFKLIIIHDQTISTKLDVNSVVYLLYCYIKRCACQSDSKFVDEHINDLPFQTFFLLSMKETCYLNCCYCCLLTSLGLFVLTVRGSEVCHRMQRISIYTEGLLVSIII